jgi:hypothetical protein
MLIIHFVEKIIYEGFYGWFAIVKVLIIEKNK